MCARVSSDDAQELGAVVAGDGHLHQREIARNRRDLTQVLDLQHVHQLVEIRGHAVHARLVAVHDERHPEMPGSASVRPSATRC
jgi:hypothetical protein